MASRVSGREPSALSTRLLAAFFVFAGVMHFVKTSSYEAIMPPYVPYQREIVYASGVAEIMGGVALLAPRLRPWARWWLVALLIAVFPANVHMAVNPEEIRGLDVPRWLLWARLPLQGALVVWVLAATRTPPPTPLGRLRARTAGAFRGR